MLIPRKVYRRITGVSAINIVKAYLLKGIPVKVEKKHTTSDGTTGDDTPKANILTLLFSISEYILGYLLIIFSWYAIPIVALTNKNKRISLNKFAMVTKTNAFSGSNNIPALIIKIVQGTKVKISLQQRLYLKSFSYPSYFTPSPLNFCPLFL